MSTPQFHTSVPDKNHTFSAPKIPQIHTKNLEPKITEVCVELGVFGVELRDFGVELR